MLVAVAETQRRDSRPVWFWKSPLSRVVDAEERLKVRLDRKGKMPDDLLSHWKKPLPSVLPTRQFCLLLVSKQNTGP